MIDLIPRHTTIGHIFGANLATHPFVTYDIARDMIDMGPRHTTIGHIFGANFEHACVIYDTYCT